MAVFFNIVLHVLLTASLAVFAYALFQAMFATDVQLERVIRSLALFCGAMVVLGAQAAGVSYADFIVESLSGTKPFTAGFIASAIPGLAGIGLGWYFIRTIKKNEDLTIRLLGFIGMLALVQFAQVYAVAIQDKGLELGATAVPNIAFLVGLMMYVIFKLDTDTTAILDRGLFGKLRQRQGRSKSANAMSNRSDEPAHLPRGRDRLR